ncbi:helix-turn-helix transcriptional regulator [Salmonella enterica]|nr:helix-turn-helix transcriptional regulator [Salmonella enterica]EJZ7016785.1 helix-turn-helix transcriptional regulator [Salmonella enterica]
MQKTPLTPEQLEDCKRLNAIFKSVKGSLGLSQESVGHMLGISQGAVSQILTGKNQITLDKAELFAKILGVPVEAFSPTLAAKINRLAQNVSPDTFEYAGILKPGRTPVTGEAVLGVNGMIEFLKEHHGWLNIHSTDPDAFVLLVRGDSLWPRVKSGEFLVIEPNTPIEPGDDVLVELVSGEQLIRQVSLIREDEYQFVSIAGDNRPFTTQSAQIQSIQFISAIVKRSRYTKN